MSNGARHGWGVLAGLVLTAGIAALLIYAEGLMIKVEGLIPGGTAQDRYIAAASFAGAAVLGGLLAGSRLSPVAALVGGVVLTGAGVLVFAAPGTGRDLAMQFPLKGQRLNVSALEGSGILLVAGVLLLVASAFPSRWRTSHPAGPMGYGDPDYAPPDNAYGRHSRGAHTQQYAEDHPYYQAPAYDNRPPFIPPGAGTQPLPRSNP